jgi:hypothetical protein
VISTSIPHAAAAATPSWLAMPLSTVTMIRGPLVAACATISGVSPQPYRIAGDEKRVGAEKGEPRMPTAHAGARRIVIGDDDDLSRRSIASARHGRASIPLSVLNGGSVARSVSSSSGATTPRAA